MILGHSKAVDWCWDDEQSVICGLCVPGLDVITSVESAKTYKLLDEFCDNINIDTIDPPTLLVYEELDGVSLADLLSLDYFKKSANGAHTHSDNDTTAQQRTFGPNLFMGVVCSETRALCLPSRCSCSMSVASLCLCPLRARAIAVCMCVYPCTRTYAHTNFM